MPALPAPHDPELSLVLQNQARKKQKISPLAWNISPFVQNMIWENVKT